MRHHKNITFKGHIIERKKPVNILSADEWLFSKELVKQIPDTEVIRVKNATILNELIIQKTKLRCYNKYSKLHPPGFFNTVKDLTLLRKQPIKIKKGIWATDEWSYNYFHFITDVLARLIGSQVSGAEYPVILPRRYENLKFVNQSLALIGFRPYYCEPGANLKVAELILPGHTAISGDYNREIIALLRDKLGCKSPNAPSKNVYISRQRANTRRIKNENEVVGILRKYNFEIHFFEDYDFDQQVKLMSETKCLISLHGAGLTNMLFMPENGLVMEFRRKDDDEFNCYFSMASLMNHHYYYQLSTIPGDDVDIDTNKFEREVNKMIK